MPWRYAEPPYTSMPSYRMTGIRFAIGGIGAGAGRQRRRPLHRSISRHSGPSGHQPVNDAPPSAATRPECAAQPSICSRDEPRNSLRSAITSLAIVPPLRACRDKSDPTRTTVLRKTHGRSIPRPPQPASDRQPPPAPTKPTHPCSIVSPPSGKSPIQGQRNGTFAGRSTCRHRPQIGKRGVISTIALSKLTGPNSLKMARICEF